MSVRDDNPYRPCVICDVDVDMNDSDRMVWIGDDVSAAELSDDYPNGPAHRGCYEADRDAEADRRRERARGRLVR